MKKEKSIRYTMKAISALVFIFWLAVLILKMRNPAEYQHELRLQHVPYQELRPMPRGSLASNTVHLLSHIDVHLVTGLLSVRQSSHERRGAVF